MGGDLCWWCGSEATLLCDAMIGCERRKSDNTLILDEPYLCDAPMCAKCAKRIGHSCGEEPDSIDMCPEHAVLAMTIRDPKNLPASAADVEKVRREIRAKAWRHQMGVVPTGKDEVPPR